MTRRNSLTKPKYRQRKTGHPTFHFRITFAADHHEITDVIVGILFREDETARREERESVYPKITSKLVEANLRNEFEKYGYASDNLDDICPIMDDGSKPKEEYIKRALVIGKELFPVIYENVEVK